MFHGADARTVLFVGFDVYGASQVLRHRIHQREQQGKGKVGIERTVQVEHFGQEQVFSGFWQFVLLYAELLYLL